MLLFDTVNPFLKRVEKSWLMLQQQIKRSHNRSGARVWRGGQRGKRPISRGTLAFLSGKKSPFVKELSLITYHNKNQDSFLRANSKK